MPKQREKLGLSCLEVDCANNLHCFRPDRAMKKTGIAGTCRGCRADIIDWSRIRSLDLNDIEFTVHSLKFESIRSRFWTMTPNQWAWNFALRRGRPVLFADAAAFLGKCIGRPSDAFDWKSAPWPDKTPWKMNPYHYARHATGTCCRKCLETWYGVPSSRPLTERELTYFAALVLRYIEEKFPNLPDAPQRVPGIRRTSAILL